MQVGGLTSLASSGLSAEQLPCLCWQQGAAKPSMVAVRPTWMPPTRTPGASSRIGTIGLVVSRAVDALALPRRPASTVLPSLTALARTLDACRRPAADMLHCWRVRGTAQLWLLKTWGHHPQPPRLHLALVPHREAL